MNIKIAQALQARAAEFLGAMDKGHFEQTEGGILFPEASALVAGVYTHDVNGQDERTDKNIVTVEGLNYILATALRGGTPESAFYLALFAGNVTPQANWTAANFTANSTEIVSNTTGYSETTRRPWVPAAASAGSLTNATTKASFSVVTVATLNVYGGALLSSPVKGGTAGVLISSSKFAAVRPLENGDIFNLGYALTMTST